MTVSATLAMKSKEISALSLLPVISNAPRTVFGAQTVNVSFMKRLRLLLTSNFDNVSHVEILGYDNFDDCQCISGYEKQGNGCVRSRFCDFSCPANSYRTPNLNCYENFNDCTCLRGYQKSGVQCIFCDFTCPPNSFRRNGIAWYVTVAKTRPRSAIGSLTALLLCLA